MVAVNLDTAFTAVLSSEPLITVANKILGDAGPRAPARASLNPRDVQQIQKLIRGAK